MFVKDGELALWVTERKQLPDKRWKIGIWLNTEDSSLSHDIHKAVADLVKNMMESAQPQSTKQER